MVFSEQEEWAGGELNSTEEQQENHRADEGAFHARQLFGVNRKVKQTGKTSAFHKGAGGDVRRLLQADCLKTGTGPLVQCGPKV